MCVLSIKAQESGAAGRFQPVSITELYCPLNLGHTLLIGISHLMLELREWNVIPSWQQWMKVI